jgi:hypothetical protein
MFFASLSIAVCLGALLALMYKLVFQTWSMNWSVRRRRVCTLVFVELVLQLINSAFYLTPNILEYQNQHGANGYLSAGLNTLEDWAFFIRWSCWNASFMLVVLHAHFLIPWWKNGKPVDKEDSLVLDAPIWYHWPKFLLGAIFQIGLIFFVLWSVFPFFGNQGCSSCTLLATNQFKARQNLTLEAYHFYVTQDNSQVIPTPDLQAAIDESGALTNATLAAELAMEALDVTPLQWNDTYDPIEAGLQLYFLFDVNFTLFRAIVRQAFVYYIIPDPAWAEITGLNEDCNIYWSTGVVAVGTVNGTYHNPSALHCQVPHFSFQLVIILAGVVVWFLWFLYYVLRASQELHKHAYVNYRMANLSHRLQLRMRLVAFAFIVVSNIILGFVNYDTINSYYLSYLGLMPGQIVMTMLVLTNSLLFFPKRTGKKNPALHVFLQDFAWTEQDLEPRKEVRGLPEEPMFCFETCLKMMYWTRLAYHYKQVEDSPYTLDAGMSLYFLEDYELVWDKERDTKVIMAWNYDTIVISFRGTASIANVKADAQVWLTRVPVEECNDRVIKVTTKWGGIAGPLLVPSVHRGFDQSYRGGGVDRKLIAKVKEILMKHADNDDYKCKIYVTGHSLGGALATLLAYDIQRECATVAPIDLACYTFGSPRTGNHAFAVLYNEKVPNTWHIINDQDAVAKQGKFVKLYKRPGQRVIINPTGDMVVRPSFVESSIHGLALRNSLAQHRLSNYLKSLIATTKSPFSTNNPANNGRLGVISLLRQTSAATVHRDLLTLGDLDAWLPTSAPKGPLGMA